MLDREDSMASTIPYNKSIENNLEDNKRREKKEHDELIIDYSNVLSKHRYFARSFAIQNVSYIQLEFRLSSTFDPSELAFSMNPSTSRQCTSVSIRAGDKKVIYILFSPKENSDGSSMIEGEAFVTCQLSKDHHESIKIRARLTSPELELKVMEDLDQSTLMLKTKSTEQPLPLCIYSCLENFEIVGQPLETPGIPSYVPTYIKVPTGGRFSLQFRLKSESSRGTRGISGDDTSLQHYSDAHDYGEDSESQVVDYLTLYLRDQPHEKYRILLYANTSGPDLGVTHIELPTLFYNIMETLPKSTLNPLHSSVGHFLRKIMNFHIELMQLEQTLNIPSILDVLLEQNFLSVHNETFGITREFNETPSNETDPLKSVANSLSQLYFELFALTDELIGHSLGHETAETSHLALLLYTVMLQSELFQTAEDGNIGDDSNSGGRGGCVNYSGGGSDGDGCGGGGSIGRGDHSSGTNSSDSNSNRENSEHTVRKTLPMLLIPFVRQLLFYLSFFPYSTAVSFSSLLSLSNVAQKKLINAINN